MVHHYRHIPLKLFLKRKTKYLNNHFISLVHPLKLFLIISQEVHKQKITPLSFYLINFYEYHTYPISKMSD